MIDIGDFGEHGNRKRTALKRETFLHITIAEWSVKLINWYIEIQQEETSVIGALINEYWLANIDQRSVDCGPVYGPQVWRHSRRA